MKVKDLIRELSNFDENTEVLVWESYNAGCATPDFKLYVEEDDIGKFILLEE